MNDFFTKVTVFTPTYNRAYILGDLYESLKKQTDKSFEWIIVDDGSTDGTKDIVSKWISEGEINIRYYYQQNGGKMRAHNFAVQNASTELFICVDSDDYLVSDSIDSIIRNETMIKGDRICGMVCYRGKDDDNVLAGYFPDEDAYSSLSGLYEKGFYGDTSLVYKTKVLKEYLFPEVDGEKFVTEDCVYHQIDQKYELAVVKKILIVSRYQQDGYTNNSLKLFRDNPVGAAVYHYYESLYAKKTKEEIIHISCCEGYLILARKNPLSFFIGKKYDIIHNVQIIGHSNSLLLAKAIILLPVAMIFVVYRATQYKKYLV